MILIFVLICSASIPITECDLFDATDALQAGKAQTPIECFQQAQEFIARTALVLQDHYMKIDCVRSQEAPLEPFVKKGQ